MNSTWMTREADGREAYDEEGLELVDDELIAGEQMAEEDDQPEHGLNLSSPASRIFTTVG